MGLDFSSSLYLGLRHGSEELGEWESLTVGAPAAFHEAPAAHAAGQAVARLQGLAGGIAAPSTLHLFWDWFGGLDSRRDSVFVDEHIYRVAAWGVERAAARGVPTIPFRHQCAAALERAIRQKLKNGRRPVVVTDGWCPFCGRAAPLREYLEAAGPFGGLLVVDDTQALGILGSQPASAMPYGKGGGGSLPFWRLKGEPVIAISSLAKAFGAPIAVLCGSKREAEAYKLRSETRLYASPPSAAAVEAAHNALFLNMSQGEALRKKLLQNVLLFREGLAQIGLTAGGGPFPVQTIESLSEKQARQLCRALLKKGLRTVPVAPHGQGARLCCLLNARHRAEDIRHACELFSGAIRELKLRPQQAGVYSSNY